MGPLVEKKKEAKEHHYLSVLNEVEAKAMNKTNKMKIL